MFDLAHIHPMLVHFPIALTLLGCLFEFISILKKRQVWFCRAGEMILYFATASAILAAVAGNLFTPHFTNELLSEAKNIHGNFAGITVTMLCVASGFYIIGNIFKKHFNTFRSIGFVFYLFAAVAVAITGYLGGVLVYNDLLKF